MRTVILNQTRMSSTRLPGKVLREMLGRPMLEYQIERLRRATTAHELVIATTTNPADDVLVALCRKWDVPIYRGSEEDVLERYFLAAVAHRAELIVRVTSDCPAIDPEVVDRVVMRMQANLSEIDYVSNTVIRSYPRGMDTEVFTFEALSKAHREATHAYEKEHVTPFFYRHPEWFRVEQEVLPTDLSEYRLTVDTIDDFELVRRVFEALYPNNPRFDLNDMITLLRQDPSLAKINAHVIQKALGQ